MGRLIIEFNTMMESREFLQDLDNLATVLHGNKGYDVWDEVSESPQGTFHVASPTGDPRFPDWKLAIPLVGAEREFPPEWATEE